MKWFDRKFNFDLKREMFPNIVERLHGTPPRLEEIIKGIVQDKLTARRNQHWSIQEHIGHLLDLEPLWIGRVHDLLDGKNRLREADLSNRKTREANHNQAGLKEILSAFRTARFKFTAILFNLENSQIEKTALHPRLDQPMRLLDLAFFTAEHDDHHLVQIRRLLGFWQ